MKSNFDRRLRATSTIHTDSCQSSTDIISVDDKNTGISWSFKRVKFITSRDVALSRRPGGPSRGHSYWYGEDGMSTLTWVEGQNGSVQGSIIDAENDLIYQFHNDIEGSLVTTVTKSSDFGEELEPENAPDRKLMSESDQDRTNIRSDPDSPQSGENRLRSLNDNGDYLDVMVLWTKEAECASANGGSTSCTVTQATYDSMMALINLAVQETNTAYSISGVQTQLRLVHAYRHPTYTENGIGADLDNLNNNIISNTHETRTQVGADLVALIVGRSSFFCGKANIGPSIDRMFSVTKYSCATGNFSFGHEIGHNLGCLHDLGTSNACSSSNYNYGYRDPNAGFRTTLAYNCNSGQCDNNAGGGCTRVQRYSTPNPSVTYNGLPVGTATADNVRQINDVRVEVAGYYPHNPTGTPTVSPVPTKFDSVAPSAAPTDSHMPSPEDLSLPVLIRSNRFQDYCISQIDSSIYLKDCDLAASVMFYSSVQSYIRSSVDENMCLEANSSDVNGELPSFQNCNQSINQRWKFVPNTGSGGGSTIEPELFNSDICLDENSQNGTVYQWNCDGTSDQYFNLFPLSSAAPSSSDASAPSASPTIIPSVNPTIAPSAIPTIAQTLPPTDLCDVMDVVGQTIFLPGAGIPGAAACWRVQLARGGTLEGDFSDASCAKEESEWQSSAGVFSIFQSIAVDDYAAVFTPGQNGFSGTFQFK